MAEDLRLLDEQDQEISREECDLTLGYIVYDQTLKEHHEATPEVQEQSHFYPNTYYFEDGTNYKVTGEEGEDAHVGPTDEKGAFTFVPQTDDEQTKIVRGIDVDRIVDVEYQQAKDAWDEYEDIKRYKLYTEEELQNNATAKATQALKEARDTQMITLMAMVATPMAASMSDEEVASIEVFIQEWEVGKSYEIGDVVRYKGGVWRALSASVAQEIYPPDQYTAGWKRIGEPDESGIYPYSQPLGATDAYQVGDKVSYNGHIYECILANNVWAPDAYPPGWKLLDEEVVEPEPEPGTDPEEPSEDEYPAFVQPTGAHDAYKKGDRVSYNGKNYESLINGNAYAPDVYPAGWKEI